MLKSNINSQSIQDTSISKSLTHICNEYHPDSIKFDEDGEMISLIKDNKSIKEYELMGYDFISDKNWMIIAFIWKDKSKGKGIWTLWKIKYVENWTELIAFDSFSDFSLNKKISESWKYQLTYVWWKQVDRILWEHIYFLMNWSKELFSTKDFKNAKITSYDVSDDGTDYICVINQEIDKKNTVSYLIRNGNIEFTVKNTPIEQVQLSDDRKNIAFITGFDSGQTIVYHNWKWSESYLRAADPTFSPDWKHLAYIAKDSMWYFIVMDNRESSERYEDIGPLVFSPDSSEISISVIYKQHFRIIKGGEKLDDILYEMPNPVYSPDWKELAYCNYTKDFSKGYWMSKGWVTSKKYSSCSYPTYSSDWSIFWYNAEKANLVPLDIPIEWAPTTIDMPLNFLIINWLELPFPDTGKFQRLCNLDHWVIPTISKGSESILITLKNIDTEWTEYRQLEIINNTYAIIRELDYDENWKIFSINNKFKYIKLISWEEMKETKWEWLDGEVIEWDKYIQLVDWKKYIRTIVWI